LNLGPHKSSAVSLPLLVTRADVAQLVGVPLHTMTWWLWARRPQRRYTRFELARSDGSARVIHAPIKPIKDMQRRFAEVLARSYVPPPHVHGFVSQRSPVSNARPHRRQEWVLRLDVADFFPSINFGRVRGLFMAFPFEYPADVATLLAQLCCHNNELPQGAPTSPIISNYICRRLDTQLARLAGSERCYYTRYADDMCFSTDRRSFPSALGTVNRDGTSAGEAVVAVVQSNGFALNDQKVRLMRNNQRQRVTGLVVNEKLNVARSYTRQLRNILYVWKRHGEATAIEVFNRSATHANWPPEKQRPNFRLVIRGRIQHVGRIKGWDDPVYLALAGQLSELDPTFSRRAAPVAARHRAQVFTEGTSDGDHLLAALRQLQKQGLFLDLALDVKAVPDLHGDDALLKHCQALARAVHALPCVCVFDSDKESIVKRVAESSGWKNWGNGVVSVALSPPPWRDGQGVCIELLYEDAVLQRLDTRGRRLFLAEEFDRGNGHHLTEEYTTPNPGGPTLVRESVHTKATGRSVGLSKKDFARAVTARKPPFADLAFAGFQATFEQLREAVAEAARDIEAAH